LIGDAEPVPAATTRESMISADPVHLPGNAKGSASGRDQFEALADEVAKLRNDVKDLQEQFAAFRKQFE